MTCPPELIENTSVDVDHFYEVEGYLYLQKKLKQTTMSKFQNVMLCVNR